MTTDAFEIFNIEGYQSGKLAICKVPLIESDFKAINDWSADVIVTMINVEEFSDPSFASQISNCAPQWMQAAVPDFGIPETDFRVVTARLLSILDNQGRVLIHCKGGQGRSGMLALRLLVEQGEYPKTALKRIRSVRPFAVETQAQEIWATDKH